jgi:hypothetical protein
VTPDALIAAIIGAKQSFADGQSPVAPAEFVAAVAERLVLPVAQVSAALEPLMSRPAGTGDKPDGQEGDRAGGKPGDKGVDRDGVKPGDKGGHTAKDTSPSPLTTEAAAQAFAGYAGVTVDQARAALATLVRRSDADGGLQPMDEVYQAVSAELGITTDQLDSALRQLKMSLADD